MGMQQENKMIQVWKLAAYLGKSMDTFRHALAKEGIATTRKNEYLFEQDVAKMCRYYKQDDRNVPFESVVRVTPDHVESGGGNLETVKGLESQVEQISKRLSVLRNERDEYRNATLEKDSEISRLLERIESEVSRNSENKERVERLESELSELRGKYESHISGTAQVLADAKIANANFNRVRAEASQSSATIENLQSENEGLRKTLAAARKGWAGFTEYDFINTFSMVVFMWAAFSVAEWVGLGAAFLGALYMKRTIYNMKTSLSDSARRIGFWVCAGVELVAGIADYLGLYKSLKDLTWLPIAPNYVAIGGAAFVILISISALYTTKKENEI